MQFYASPEQIMRDRSEYARKGIARGRSSIVLTYEGGVLFVAENMTALHKVSEIYDRIGFAAVGRYNEFENLRTFGIRLADLRGYSYDRRDVTGRGIANAYAQNLGAIFTEQTKPFEVEVCVAQVGHSAEQDELYRITYDGSVQDEPGVVIMGGQAEAMAPALRSEHRDDMTLAEALHLAVKALASVGGENGQPRTLAANQLEVAVLDRRRPGRTFRRIVGAALTGLLETPPTAAEQAEQAEQAAGQGAPAPGPVEPAGAGHAQPAPADEQAPTEPPSDESASNQQPPADEPPTDAPAPTQPPTPEPPASQE
jgi:proteasome alpha subunit